MNLLDALARLHVLPTGERASLFDEPVALVGQDGQSADCWAAYATGLASLSGQLEDAATDADLADAVRHGAALLNAEIISPADAEQACLRVLQEIARMGEGMELAGGVGSVN